MIDDAVTFYIQNARDDIFFVPIKNIMVFGSLSILLFLKQTEKLHLKGLFIDLWGFFFSLKIMKIYRCKCKQNSSPGTQNFFRNLFIIQHLMKKSSSVFYCGSLIGFL